MDVLIITKWENGSFSKDVRSIHTARGFVQEMRKLKTVTACSIIGNAFTVDRSLHALGAFPADHAILTD